LTLRKEFSLVNSEFNDFLFAPIYEEGNGMTLSVMSAFSRLDLDPWQEAARLSELSKEKAVDALAPILARLAGTREALADTREIAARLIAFLPRRDAVSRARANAARGPVNRGSAKRNSQRNLLMITLAVSAAILFSTVLRHQSSTNDAGAPTESSATDTRR